MQQEEFHPWKWFVPKKATTLMIGTFPPAKRNWSYDFFYPNKQNLFWNIMAAVAGIELKHFSGEEAVNERKNILGFLNVAITDMGNKIIRNNNSSLDENIFPLEFMDIFKILDENPQLNKLVFTSSSGPSSAAKWFIQYLKSKNIEHKFPSGPKPLKSGIHYKERKVDLLILYSPSRRASNRISFELLFAMYKSAILSDTQNLK